MPGIFLNPSGCCCHPCAPGSICVGIGGDCNDSRDVLVTVTGASPETAGVSVSGWSTSPVNQKCFDDLPAGKYHVTASKDGCTAPSWPDVDLQCGAVVGLGGWVECPHSTELTVCVKGCNDLPLPGAVVTVSGPEGSGGTCTAGNDGCCGVTITKNGAHSIDITHPSGRFKPYHFTAPSLSNCVPYSAFDLILFPADGYLCCVPGTPFPCRRTLFITDSEGGTTSIFLSDLYCAGETCSPREMEHVADPEARSFCDCDGGGFATMPPPTGKATTALGWSLALTPGYVLLQQRHPVPNLVGGSLLYPLDCPDTGSCGPPLYRSNWRLARECNTPGSPDYNVNGPFPQQFPYRLDGKSVVWANVDSLYPFACTFVFDGGTGFGPVLDPGFPSPSVSGDVFAKSAVVHE